MKLSIIIHSVTLFAVFTAVRGTSKDCAPIGSTNEAEVTAPAAVQTEEKDDFDGDEQRRREEQSLRAAASRPSAARHSVRIAEMEAEVYYYKYSKEEKQMKLDAINTVRSSMKNPSLYVSGAGIESYNGIYTKYPNNPLLIKQDKALRYWVNENGKILGYNTAIKRWVLGPYTMVGKGSKPYGRTRMVKGKDGITKPVFKATEWTANHEKFGAAPNVTRLTQKDDNGNEIQLLEKFKFAPTWHCDCRTCDCGWIGYTADCPKCDKKAQVKEPEGEWKAEKMDHGICNVCLGPINDGEVIHAKVCVDCDWDACQACKQTQAGE